MLWWWRRPRATQIDPDLWSAVLGRCALIRAVPQAQLDSLKSRSARFLARHRFEYLAGAERDPVIELLVAAKSVLPCLWLGDAALDGFDRILLYPGEFRARRHEVDDHGVAHEFDETLIGETDDGAGPILLSIRDVLADAGDPQPGCDVVIHEIAHKVDALDGSCDGVPRFQDLAERRHFKRLSQSAFERLREAITQAEDESELLIDPYAGESPEEFFAVMSEYLFTAPADFRAFDAELHLAYDRFYRFG